MLYPTILNALRNDIEDFTLVQVMSQLYYCIIFCWTLRFECS